MRLINPGPGALTDRMTILTLKSQAAAIRGIPYQHFDEEWQGCMAAMTGWLNKSLLPVKGWDELHGELCKVNSQLWTLEASQRDLLKREAGHDEHDFLLNAIRILELNDVRAGLVAKIDAMFGITAPEKIY